MMIPIDAKRCVRVEPRAKLCWAYSTLIGRTNAEWESLWFSQDARQLIDLLMTPKETGRGEGLSAAELAGFIQLADRLDHYRAAFTRNPRVAAAGFRDLPAGFRSPVGALGAIFHDARSVGVWLPWRSKKPRYHNTLPLALNDLFLLSVWRRGEVGFPACLAAVNRIGEEILGLVAEFGRRECSGMGPPAGMELSKVPVVSWEADER